MAPTASRLLARRRRGGVGLFYSQGEVCDPGGRGGRPRDFLAARKRPYVVIDQPRQLTSHWAAATPQFARLFGSCMLGFLDAAQIAEGARCDGDTFWAGAPQSLPIQPAVAAAGSAQGTAGQRPDRP